MAEAIVNVAAEETRSWNQPPVLDSLTPKDFSIFLKRHEAYRIRGGTRLIKSLVASDQLVWLNSIPGFAELTTNDEVRTAILKFMSPTTVHQALDQFARIRMRPEAASHVDLNAIQRYIQDFTDTKSMLSEPPKDSAIVRIFIANLLPLRLRDRVHDSDTSTWAATISSTREAAVALKAALAEADALMRLRIPTAKAEMFQRPRSAAQEPAAPRSPDIICHTCGTPGHKSPACPQRGQKPPLQAQPPPSHPKQVKKEDGTPTDAASKWTRGPKGRLEKSAPAGSTHHLTPVSTMPRLLVTLSGTPTGGTLRVAALLDSGSSVSCISPIFLESLQKIGVRTQPMRPQSLSTPGTQVLEVSQQVRAHVTVAADCQFDDTFVVVPMMEHLILSWSTIMQNGLFDVFHSREDLRAPPPGYFGASNALTSLAQFPAKLTFSPVLTLPTVVGTAVPTAPSCFHPVLTLHTGEIELRNFSTLTNNMDESFKSTISPADNFVVAAPILIEPSVVALDAPGDAIPTRTNVDGGQQNEDLSFTAPVASVDVSSPDALARVSALADTFATLFEDQLPPDGAHVPPFKIELMPNSPPLVTRFRRLSPPIAAKVEHEVQSLLQAGIIARAEASFVSPTILVPKANSSELRLCVDYKQLNAITKDYVFPLADPRTLLESLAGHRYFATLDLRQGFHQILMDPDSASATAFSTKTGICQFLRMPFGVKNGPRYFQKVITDTLRSLLGTACEVFIDDVIVFGRTFQDFISNLELVFKALSDANFRLKRSKCVLLASKVEYLGYFVD